MVLQGIHTWPCKTRANTLPNAQLFSQAYQYMAKEQCGQELVPAFGQGMEILKMRENMNEQNFA